MPPAATEPRRGVVASLIAADVVIKGDVSSDGDVHLDGTILGDLRVSRLTIGETGRVQGAIEAQAVDVRGTVQGTIAAQTVRLLASAKVEGDITQAQLSVEPGAHFAGRSVAYETPASSVEHLGVAAE